MEEEFDYIGAVKAGYTPEEIQVYISENYDTDFDLVGAKGAGYSDEEIQEYFSTSLKKKGKTQPQEEVSTSDSQTPTQPSGESGEEIDFNAVKYGVRPPAKQKEETTSIQGAIASFKPPSPLELRRGESEEEYQIRKNQDLILSQKKQIDEQLNSISIGFDEANKNIETLNSLTEELNSIKPPQGVPTPSEIKNITDEITNLSSELENRNKYIEKTYSSLFSELDKIPKNDKGEYVIDDEKTSKRIQSQLEDYNKDIKPLQENQLRLNELISAQNKAVNIYNNWLSENYPSDKAAEAERLFKEYEAFKSVESEGKKRYEQLAEEKANLISSEVTLQSRKDAINDKKIQDFRKDLVQNLPISQQAGMYLFGGLKMGLESISGSLATSQSRQSEQILAPEDQTQAINFNAVKYGIKPTKEQDLAFRKNVYEWGQKMYEKSKKTEVDYGLVNSLKNVDNPLDVLSFALTSIAEQAPQIPLAITTFGGSTYFQELGGMQQEIVQYLMDERGMTLEEALDSEEANKMATNLTALGIASLDMLGLVGQFGGKVLLGNTIKSGIKQSAVDRIVLGTTSELATETGQEFLAKGGVSQAKGSGFIEGMKEMTSDEIKDLWAKVLFSSGTFTSVNTLIEGRVNKDNIETLNEASTSPEVLNNLTNHIQSLSAANVISTEEADRQIAELNASVAANLQIPESIQGEQRARIVELQKEYNALAEEQKRVPPAFKEMYKQKMDAVQEKIAEIVNQPQKKDEIEERRQEELNKKQKFVSSKKRQEREGGEYKEISVEDIDLEASNLEGIPSDAKVIVLEERGLNSDRQRVGTVRIVTKDGADTIEVVFNTDKINAKYDAEYVDAVNKGEITKEQAMQALEEAGRKESAAYAELAALEQQKPQEDVAQEQPTDEQFDAALEILEPIASERRELTLEELENVYTALGENADQVFDISRKDKNAVDLYNELTDKKNAKEARQVRKEGEQVQAEETGVGDMQEQPITQEETEEAVVSKGVRVKNAPDGTYIDIEMIAGKDGRKLTPEEVLDAIPIDGIEFDNDGTNLRIKLPRELTSSEMMSLMKATEQEAIGQLSNGIGKLYAQSKKLLEDYGNEFNEKYFKTPREGKLNKYEKKPKAGNRIFNKPLEAVKEIANKYYERVFGKKRPVFKGITKIDKKLAKRIANAYEAMQNNPNDPEVRAAYEALARETMEQYKAFSDAGFIIEINNEEPYNNAQEMIDDLRENKRIKIFSTESGFGDTPITDKQRKENPLLRDSGIKDANGNTLLINDLFRAIHDFYGHAELGNGFGAIGEENAWNVHARMFSPLARRAMTTETRGQNSWVNFSGINEEAFKLRDKARELRKQGKEAEAQELIKKVYEMMSFAKQKVGLLPQEFSRIYEGVLRQEQLQVGLQEEIKVGDTVNATVEVYESGKKKSKRFKVEVTAVNEDGTYNLKRGKLIYKNIKPENIAKIKPPRARSITQETQGLTEKEQAKQGVEEIVQAYKNKLKDVKDIMTQKIKEAKESAREKQKAIRDAGKSISDFIKESVPTGIKIPKSITAAAARATTPKAVEKVIDRIEGFLEKSAISSAKKKAIATQKSVAKKIRDTSEYTNKERAVQNLLSLLNISNIDDVSLLNKIQKVLNDLNNNPIANVRQEEIDSLIGSLEKYTPKVKVEKSVSEENLFDTIYDEEKSTRQKGTALNKLYALLEQKREEANDIMDADVLALEKKIEEAEAAFSESVKEEVNDLNSDTDQLLKGIDTSDMTQEQKDMVDKLKKAPKSNKYRRAKQLNDIAIELVYGYAPIRAMQDYITSTVSEQNADTSVNQIDEQAKKRKTKFQEFANKSWGRFVVPKLFRKRGISIKSLRDVISDLRLEAAERWDDFFGLGKSKPIQKYVLSPVETAITALNKEFRNAIDSLYNQGVISEDSQRKIVMAVTQGYWSNYKDDRNYWKTLLDDETFKNQNPKRWEQLKKDYDSMPKMADGKIDFDAYLDGLTGKEKKVYDWIVKNNEVMLEKQRIANERRGQKFEPINSRYYIPMKRQGSLFAIETDDSFVDNLFTMIKDGATKLKSDRGEMRTSGKIDDLNMDLYGLVGDQIFQTLRDYNITEAVRQSVKTMSKIAARTKDQDAKKFATAMVSALKSRISNEFGVKSDSGMRYLNFMFKYMYQYVLMGTRLPAEGVAEAIRMSGAADVTKQPKAIMLNLAGVSDIFEFTNSPFLSNLYFENLDYVSGRTFKKSIIGRGADWVGTANQKILSIPDSMTFKLVWLPSFINQFKNVSGKEFNISEYKKDKLGYLKQNENAVREAAAFADSETQSVKGSKTRFGQRESVRVLPEFLVKTLEAVSGKKYGYVGSATVMGRLISTLQNFAFLEQLNIGNNIRESIYAENKSRSRATGELFTAVASGTVYTWTTAMLYNIVGMLYAESNGDDDEKEKFVEEIKELRSTDGVWDSAISNGLFLATGKYGNLGKTAVLIASGLYDRYMKNNLSKKEYKEKHAELVDVIRGRYFAEPIDIGGYKSEADIINAVAPFVSRVIGVVGQAAGGIAEGTGKIIKGDTDEYVLMKLMNDIIKLTMFATGTPLPFQKDIDKFLYQKTKDNKKQKGTIKPLKITTN